MSVRIECRELLRQCQLAFARRFDHQPPIFSGERDLGIAIEPDRAGDMGGNAYPKSVTPEFYL